MTEGASPINGDGDGNGNVGRLAQAYESLCRPDRPADADRDRRPLLAGLLSLPLPGAGQLYNRQLFKALALIVVALICGAIATAWLVLRWIVPTEGEGWLIATGRFVILAGVAALIVGGGLWLFAIIDAIYTAAALRAGRLVVRYSFKKQAAMIAAGMLPVAGMFVPGETRGADEADPQLTSKRVAHQLAMTFVKRKVMSLLKLFVVIVGLIPIVLGAVFAMQGMVIFGACVVLVGLIVFLL